MSIWQPTPNYQGWLNTLPGGIQSVLLDEICGWVVMRKLQTAGVTSQMETRYPRPVSTEGGQITLRARIKEQRRNIALIEASLHNSTGDLFSQAICTCFTFPPEKARSEMFFQGCEAEE